MSHMKKLPRASTLWQRSELCHRAKRVGRYVDKERLSHIQLLPGWRDITATLGTGLRSFIVCYTYDMIYILWDCGNGGTMYVVLVKPQETGLRSFISVLHVLYDMYFVGLWEE